MLKGTSEGLPGCPRNTHDAFRGADGTRLDGVSSLGGLPLSVQPDPSFFYSPI